MADANTVVYRLLDDADESEIRRYLDSLPSVMSNAVDTAVKMFAKQFEEGAINRDNFGARADSITDEVVNKFDLITGNELVDIDTYNKILAALMQHVEQYGF